ncbi:MAG: ribosome-associated translation inhibitor RaiA [Candidatus Thiodiazotropha sp. (ex Lucinoma kastoroae)]|nr:ribosome-associated translation inhibitor RaiA [Candidatus Thiodiazotropha sp. (ex Rostrolucina anterorostrata)]MCU7848376.1 ribosome-associated translation inhibitor RaiA [Candidatus Thiodiazotropha sp. (ex Lucinoma kastoroae)]MCU7859732.1 ribosome-associated translation inhibitor RaiA [Candidatus Thiodiazotropha sp. (ex Lucinoma kastoroae)]
MQISVTGHHVDVTDALKSYVDNKFERLERHFDNVINVHVILSVEKMRQKAEATMQVNGASVFADSVQEDMYAAIDVLTDKLDRQVLKHKEKMQSHRAGSGVKYAATE